MLNKSNTYFVFKRTMDIMISYVLLLVLFPLFIIIELLIMSIMGRPIFFKHKRPGLNCKPFILYKFRTMTQAKDQYGNLLTDAERTTRIGKFLRASSLDELPELINVLKGEMSLIGPRPLLMEYLDHYSVDQLRRHDVRPGITGLAQISGRQIISFSRRLELDLWYVDNCSFKVDLKILILTIPRVFLSRGVIIGQDVKEVDDLGLSQPK
jgi:lipopolysaccharide/colanic/teichoic acid biosynthesis glycosyltransferase